MVRKIMFLVLLFTGLQVFSQQSDSITVLHMKVQANIDPRTNRYTELGLDHAREIGADYVILELDTYGGALNDADEIRTRILEFEIPVYAYINKDAASAGA
ncbi:MAG: nodulation protein NfeD, partial [Cyclobacteriaceae bacterium]